MTQTLNSASSADDEKITVFLSLLLLIASLALVIGFYARDEFAYVPQPVAGLKPPTIDPKTPQRVEPKREAPYALARKSRSMETRETNPRTTSVTRPSTMSGAWPTASVARAIVRSTRSPMQHAARGVCVDGAGCPVQVTRRDERCDHRRSGKEVEARSSSDAESSTGARRCADPRPGSRPFPTGVLTARSPPAGAPSRPDPARRTPPP